MTASEIRERIWRALDAILDGESELALSILEQLVIDFGEGPA